VESFLVVSKKGEEKGKLRIIYSSGCPVKEKIRRKLLKGEKHSLRTLGTVAEETLKR